MSKTIQIKEQRLKSWSRKGCKKINEQLAIWMNVHEASTLPSLYAEGQVELFKPFDEFDKQRKDVRILFLENALTEH